MAIKWSIVKMDYDVSKDGKTNVVNTVHWEVDDRKEIKNEKNEVVNSYYGRQYGAVYPDTSDLSNFVEYDNLDEDTVVGWVKSLLGNDEVKSMEDSVERQISEQESPTKGHGKPW